jgi:hypothetical protein
VSPFGPAPRPSPRRRRRLLAIGGAIVAIAAVGGGVELYNNRQLAHAYSTGHSAYLRADCANAIGPLHKAEGGETSSGSKTDTALRAAAELQECQALLAATDLDTEGRTAEAVLAYSAFVTKYPRSPLTDTSLTKGQTVISRGPPERIGTVAVCQALGTLEAQRFLVTPTDVLPPLLYACGNTFESQGALDDALAMYQRFRTDFPNHALISDVNAAYVRVTLAQADVTGAGELGQPNDDGRSGEPGDATTVVIRNDSPEPITVVLNGPETRIVELPGCATCQTFTTPPTECPLGGAEERYTVKPGAYDVVVKATNGASVVPFRGNWTLAEGQGYSECFYLVRK